MLNKSEQISLSEKKVSVVIPTHNRGNLIERAVRSAINQTHKKIEVIVVSDGSEDNTDDVMEKLAQEDSRIRYISYHPSKGGNVARNIGIDNAEFEYVAFLDDDDQWHNDKLEKQLLEFSKDSELGLVCTGINSIHVKEGITNVFIPSAPKDASKEILIRNCIGSTTTVMVKKELFESCGKFDSNLKALQDYDLWIRLCQKTKVGVVKEPCVEYYNYPNSNQISKNTGKYIEAVEYIEQKYKSLISNLSDKERAERNNVFMLLLSKKGIKNRQPKLAREYALKALKHKTNKQALMCLIASAIPYNKIMIIRDKLKLNRG